MEAENRLQGTAVTGVIGEDVHIVGIRIIERALMDAELGYFIRGPYRRAL